MQAVQRFTLKKNERLKSRKTIELLFSKGQRFVVPSFRVFYLFQQKGTAQPLQAGFSASSRVFKTAVHRNRIKRLTREAWRLQKNELQEKLKEKEHSLAVFLIYTGKLLPDYSEVSEAVKQILSKLTNMAGKKN